MCVRMGLCDVVNVGPITIEDAIGFWIRFIIYQMSDQSRRATTDLHLAGVGTVRLVLTVRSRRGEGRGARGDRPASTEHRPPRKLHDLPTIYRDGHSRQPRRLRPFSTPSHTDTCVAANAR